MRTFKAVKVLRKVYFVIYRIIGMKQSHNQHKNNKTRKHKHKRTRDNKENKKNTNVQMFNI